MSRWKAEVGLWSSSALLALRGPQVALAMGGGTYKWESVISQVINSLTGPVAGGVAIAAIAIFGLTLALSEGGAIRVVIGILLGLSIAASAPALASGLFGFSAGALLP